MRLAEAARRSRAPFVRLADRYALFFIHARLQSIETNGPIDPQRLLGLAASLAQASTHPISQAIVDAAHQCKLPLCVPQGVEESPGAGLSGQVDGGNDAPMTDWATTMLRHMDYQACSASFIAVDGELAGLLVFLDTVRRETPQTLRRLRNRGIERIVMLTGDRLETAEMIALSAGIDELRAGLTPEDKVQAVQQGCQRASTLMVGDGINDAPRWRRPTLAVEALDIARHTRFIARQGVLVGMGMSLLAMALAALGYLPPLIGAVVQEGIDVVIIVNALRALGPFWAQGKRKLAAEHIDHLQAEHQQLGALPSDLHRLANDFARRAPEQARTDLSELVNHLQTSLAQHEREDEQTLYPLLVRNMTGEDPLSAMSHVHREIFRLIHLLARMSDDFSCAPRHGNCRCDPASTDPPGHLGATAL